ncbi:MAG TPA: glycosyltransferase family 39 protein [Xanthobacteraceae bacterium]
MVSISLFVELLRTRPLTLFWTMAGLQIVLWTLVPLVFYSAPPGQLPLVLAIGHEFQLGTDFGPPLAFWLAELAYRAAGMFGVYLLSQVCIVVTYWAVLNLGRHVVGEIHAVMAVLLMAGVAVFSVPTPEFGPAILATPLWALLLFHYWRAAHHGDFVYWLAVGIEAGLLLLTTYGGLILIGLVVLFMMSSKVGRSHLESVGPWVAGLVTVSILFPYLVWLDLGGGTRLIGLAQVVQNLRMWGWMLAALLVGHLGLAILVVLGRGYIFPSRSKPPEVMREGVDPGARVFVYFFALAPVLAMGLFSLLSPRPENFMAAPLAAMSGLAVIVAAGDRIRIEHQYVIGYAWAALMILPPVLVALAVTVQPWIFAVDLRVGRPAKDIGQFFAESFQRRTGKPLEIVGGALPIAALISLTAPTRPSLYLEAAAEYLPRVTRREIEEKGAVVVWAATDTTGRLPAEILRQFPDLVAEVPRAFTRRFQGRMPLHRLGWGMIRPHTPGVTPEPQPEPPPVSIPAPPPEPQWQMPQFPQTPPQAQQPAAPAPAPAPAPTTREQPQRQPRTVPQLERHAPQ